MTHKIMTATWGIAALALTAGCTETLDSKQIRTRGISATIETIAESETSTTVTATLKAGGDESNTYVILGGGDAIFAEADGERVDMVAESSGVYEAEFGTGAADVEFTVLLERNDDDDAVNNSGSLPPPFALGDLPAEPASRVADLTVTWTPGDSGDEMEIYLDGRCIFPETIDVPGDPGTFTIKGSTLRSTNPDLPESCDVDVLVSRARDGKTDPNFDPESSFVLKQVRSGRFTSTP